MLNLRVQNFRGLRTIDWTIPQGVSALVGPNGSGKSTLLGVLEILQLALKRGMNRALEMRGGLWGLRTLGTPDEEPVDITIADVQRTHKYSTQPVLGGWDESIEFPDIRVIRDISGNILFGEEVVDTVRDDDKRLLVEVAMDEAPLSFAVDLTALTRPLKSFRLHDRYVVDLLRKNGSELTSDQVLTKSGKNVFAVLKNWVSGSRVHRARYMFVCEALRDAFPGVFADFEFESAGQVVSARIVRPRSEESVPCFFAPMGFWVAMLHLTAVASSQDNSVIAFDGFDNELHPFAVRSLIESIREWAEQHELSVILATHSPVVLDQFKGNDADRIFVMEPSEKVLPVPLSKLCNPDWLAQFAYGDLYAHERFGAPRVK